MRALDLAVAGARARMGACGAELVEAAGIEPEQGHNRRKRKVP